MTTLAERLQRALVESTPPMRKADLQKKVGVSSAAVTLWFNGTTTTMSGDNLVKVAAALNVLPKWLADGTPPMRADDSGDVPVARDRRFDTVIQDLLSLPTHEQDELVTLIAYRAARLRSAQAHVTMDVDLLAPPLPKSESQAPEALSQKK